MKTRLNNIFAVVLALSVTSMFVACGGNQTGNGTDGVDTTDTMETTEDTTSAEPQMVVYYAMPSPLEIATLLKSAGAVYNKELLNSTENMSNYSTTVKKALNLGVYGADLSYTALLGNSQDALNYLVTSKKLADNLGLNSAFEKELISKIERNITDKDSLLDLVNDFYYSSEAYLEENERGGTSALIAAGGWIEGLHIGTSLVDNFDEDNEIALRVAEQKVTLNNLIAMLEKDSGENLDKAWVVDNLKTLQEEFNKVDLAYTKQETVVDESTGLTRIVNPSKINISKEQFEAISAKVDQVRAEFVK